ncbi:zinc-binding dehydrogenase [Streptomyces sp. ISL-22]|nr:zinc-binding dehydrogenase [Streptomyces sp. ISL-24]MBT2432662.1 zinc-binding dehydrogenase [Streptomyces sp. ISL-22]
MSQRPGLRPTSSLKRRAKVRRLIRAWAARDKLIDYLETDFATALRDVDVALDTIGGDYVHRSLRILRKGGLLVTLVPKGSKELPVAAEKLGVRAIEMLVDADHTGMKETAALVEAGRLRATIASTLPPAEAAKAHVLGETGRTTGMVCPFSGVALRVRVSLRGALHRSFRETEAVSRLREALPDDDATSERREPAPMQKRSARRSRH